MSISDKQDTNLPAALSVGGLDPSGGAGVLADVVTFRAMRVMAAAAVTSITIQNPSGVLGRKDLEPDIIRQQLLALFSEMDFKAVKIGMIGTRRAAEVVAEVFKGEGGIPLVLDPVLRSGTGQSLSNSDLVSVMIDSLVPMATLVTPNINEAEELCGIEVKGPDSMETAARMIVGMGARAALVTGGIDRPKRVVDVFYDGEVIEYFSELRLPVERVHGTGCMLSSVVAGGLAWGWSLERAVTEARKLVRKSMVEAVRVGDGDPVAYLGNPVPGAGLEMDAGEEMGEYREKLWAWTTNLMSEEK